MGTSGICLTASGHSCMGVYAYNLAVSLKFKDPVTPIALFYEPATLEGLRPPELTVFDAFIELKPKHGFWYEGRINPVGWKLKSYLFTPFDRTILIDADSLWFGPRPISSYFSDEMSGIDWACLSKGVSYSVESRPDERFLDHGTVKQLKQEFKIPWNRVIHVCHTQWLYYTRCAKTDAFMKSVVELYDRCQRGLAFQGSKWRGQMVNDELPLTVSTALHDTKPGLIPFNPTTDGSEKTLTAEQVIVNIVGKDTTEKSINALKLYKEVCGQIAAANFKWTPRPWSPKVYPY